MRPPFAVLILLLAIAFLAATPTTLTPSMAAPSGPVRTLAVDYWRNYSDPASDVMKLYGSNLTPVIVSGAFVMSPFPDSVNLIWVRSGQTPDLKNVTVTFQVKGSIANLANTTYEARLYTRQDNRTHFILDYTNRSTTLHANTTGAPVTNLTGNSTISSTGPNPTSQNTLTVNVSVALLGNVTTWNLDATATRLGSPYSYRDFGWDLPGNPGSTPTQFSGRVTDEASGAGLSGVNVSAGAALHTTTNATGWYTLPVPAATYNVTFTLSGYYAVTRQATATYGATTALSVAMQKLSLVDSMGIWLWVIVGVVLMAVVVIAVLLLRRRRAAPPGK